MPIQSAALILGSASPRRHEILQQLGLTFRVVPPNVPEPPPDGEEAIDYARRLAELKATSVAARPEVERSGFVLGADTIVVLAERVLGKPRNDAEALSMLSALSGTTHEVITAVSLVIAGQGTFETMAVRTRVRLRSIDSDALRDYVASGEGRDKAGSYAAQGLGAGLVEHIEGSYSNVVGLPASETIELLLRAGALRSWP
jgi:septum formation protein